MKRILFVWLTSLLISCSRDTKPAGSALWFAIQIESLKNIDCGFPEISFLANHVEAYKVIGNDMGRYVALGLPDGNYNVGDKLLVRIRRPYISEMPVCHSLGFAWAQVYITAIK